MRFQWNSAKAADNLDKHGSFGEAATVFRDPLSATALDLDRSLNEERFITFGVSTRGRLLVVVHADRDDTIRIISARPVTSAERKLYEEGRPQDD